MIIDSHNSIIPWNEKVFEQLYGAKMLELFRPCSYGNVLGQMDRLGIDRLITWNVAARPELSSLCNDWTARVRDRNPDRFIGFCCVHPGALDEAITEVDRAIHELGLRGLKLHCQVQQVGMSDPNVRQLIQKAKEMNLPVVLHVNPPGFEEFESFTKNMPEKRGTSQFTQNDFLDIMKSELCDPNQLQAVVETYDSPKVMAAHMGGVFFRPAVDSRISFQTTGASKKIIEWACRSLGAERVVFGTDLPFFKMDEELAKVTTADLSFDDKEKVLSTNILRILEE
jgi:predicted TIM-barrel fold metal-dependent hydrolase